jgi:dolichol-phosphate mannosyltransferase
MSERILTILPVYNEVAHEAAALNETLRFSPEVLVVNDGSTDGTTALLSKREDVQVVNHPWNMGYGAGLRTGFRYAIRRGYDIVVTIDCDGQHEPCRIPQFVEACHGVDVVSGSRYLQQFSGDSTPPELRRRINQVLTQELNQRLGLGLTDAFCGFKAYRVEALKRVQLTDNGYAMPLEFWVQAAALGLKVVELPVPLIYLDEKRSFGGAMDNADTRLAVYREVLERALRAVGRGSMPVAMGDVPSLCAGECPERLP